MTVTFDDILAARDRIAGQVDRTPVRHSRRLSQLTGAEVWVKFDNLHFTGSFKERGALNRLLQLSPDERQRGVVAASAAHQLGGVIDNWNDTAIVQPSRTDDAHRADDFPISVHIGRNHQT